jgi:hypothetical protein
MELRSDADLQAIQTSVAFKNISDAVEQYRRQFGLAFLALVAFSAIHVGLVVIANLYTMQTKLHGGVMTDAADPSVPVATGESRQSFDLQYIMSNLEDGDQLRALSEVRTAAFVDREGTYRQYSVTGFQLGGWKRSELKLYTSVGHVLEYVRGRGVQVYSESGVTGSSPNSTRAGRHLLQAMPVVNVWNGKVTTLTAPDTDSSPAEWQAFSEQVNTAQYGNGLNQWATASMGNSLDDVAASAGSAAITNIEQMAANGWADSGASLNSMWGSDARQAASKTAFAPAVNSYINVAAGEAKSVDWVGANNDWQAAKVEAVAEGQQYLADEGLPATWKAALEKEDLYATSGLAEYHERVALLGSYDAFIVQEASMVVVQLVVAAEAASASWTQFAQTGHFGAAATGETTTQGSGTYACTGMTESEIAAAEMRLNDSNGPTDVLTNFCDDLQASLIGGTFFSPVLGGYDSFVAHINRDILCAGQSPKPASDVGVWYLYFLHGWGESAFVMFEMEPVIEFIIAGLVQTRPGSGLANLATFVVNDMGCPYGGKTWYANNIFTGYHMDLIAFDLPAYAESTLSLAALGKGLFGFSMGGFGAVSISLTYPALFVGSAFFNAVLDGNPCFWYGYCHALCGLDHMDCDMKWTTIHVAFAPYITVSAGSVLSSTGSFDPVAYGVAWLALESGSASCLDSSFSITDKYTAMTGRTYTTGSMAGAAAVADAVADAVTNPGRQGPIVFTGSGTMLMRDNNVLSGGYLPPGSSQALKTDAMGPGYFNTGMISFGSSPAAPYYGYYLNIIDYTRSAQHFDPTYNTQNDARQNAAWSAMLHKQPLHRIGAGKGWSSTDNFILVSCDVTDPYHLNDQALAFGASYSLSGMPEQTTYGIYSVASASMGANGGMILDAAYSEPCGHCMNVRDVYVAYAFFADVFDTWTVCAGDTTASGARVVAWSGAFSSATALAADDAQKTECFSSFAPSSRWLGHTLRGKRFRSLIGVKPLSGRSRDAQYLTRESMSIGAGAGTHTLRINLLAVQDLQAATHCTFINGKAAAYAPSCTSPCYGFDDCRSHNSFTSSTQHFAKGSNEFFGESASDAQAALAAKGEAQAQVAAATAALRAEMEDASRLPNM